MDLLNKLLLNTNIKEQQNWLKKLFSLLLYYILILLVSFK